MPHLVPKAAVFAGGFVFDRCFGAALAALLLSLTLPLHLFRSLRARRRFAPVAGPPNREPDREPLESGPLYSALAECAPAPPAPEFAFEGAISAYEDLIDSTCAQTGALHVAMVIPTLDRIAGAERQVMLLAAGMCRRGWRVTVVVLSGACRSAADELCEAGVQFLSLGMRKGLADPRGWTRFIGWLRREKPDVVHAHLPHAAWLARWSRLFAPAPVVIDTLHSSSTGGVGRHLGYRLSRGLPHRVTAVSHSVAESHLAMRMVRRQTMTVLPNGVDVDEWRPDENLRAEVRRELGLEDEFLWLAVGRLDMVKDYPTLLKAMAAVPAPARLVIAGRGPLLNNLARLSAHLGLNERVKFLGFEKSIRRWLQAADGFVLASRWEGLPMALLEAAAFGLPSVATDVPGSREVVLDGETGTLVPPLDASALAWAMTAMMRTPAEARRCMGARARQRVVEQFSLASSLDRWEDLYCDLLSSKSRETVLCRTPVPSSRCASASDPRSAF
jgi:glycosyltransferase involved in cell wall biosynthesis